MKHGHRDFNKAKRWKATSFRWSDPPLKHLVDYRRVPKVTYDGRTFGSKLEASLYQYLKCLEQNGEVSNIRCQVHVYLTRARYHCIPDFLVFDERLKEDVYYEAKGYEGERWPTTKKLWKVYGPGRLRIYKGSSDKIRLAEEIMPSDILKLK